MTTAGAQRMDFPLAHRHFDIGEDRLAGDTIGQMFDVQ